jgi:excisionase family DNA binding protein
MLEPLFTYAEAAKALKIGLTTLKAEIARGRLQTCRVGKRGRRITHAQYLAYVKKLEAESRGR